MIRVRRLCLGRPPSRLVRLPHTFFPRYLACASSPSIPPEPVIEVSATTSGHVPPFAMRVALVASTTGLMTPLLAGIGLVGSWYRFKPATIQGWFIKSISLVAFGAGAYTIVFRTIIPFLSNHAELVLPFAMSNVVAASVTYGILENVLGLETMAGNLDKEKYPILHTYVERFGGSLPIGGPLVGGISACTCFLAWPLMIKIFWPIELQHAVLGQDLQLSWLGDLYVALLLPVGIPIGVTAGLGIHYMLRDTLIGTANSTPLRPYLILGGVLLASAIYFYICSSSTNDLYWELRIDPLTGAVKSYNVRTGETRPGPMAANNACLYRNTVAMFTRIDMGGVWHYLMTGENNASLASTNSSPIKNWKAVNTDKILAGEIDHHMAFHLFLDRLLRLKSLSIDASISMLDLDEEEILKFKTLYGLDPIALLKDVEALIVLRRRAVTGDIDAKLELETVQRRIHRSATKLQPSSFLSSLTGDSQVSEKLTGKTFTNAHATKALLKNLDLLEARMRDELGYEIDEVALVHHRRVRAEQKWEQIISAFKMFSGVSLLTGATILFLYLQHPSSRR